MLQAGCEGLRFMGVTSWLRACYVVGPLTKQVDGRTFLGVAKSVCLS